MPVFKRCCVCGLVLPLSVMQPIKVKDNSSGRIIVVGICSRCKEKKEKRGSK